MSDLEKCLISPNEIDRNCEPANVVDGLFEIARAIRYLAKSVDLLSAEIGPSLVSVSGLESISGVATSLSEVAQAIAETRENANAPRDSLPG